ncbi:MAG: Hsp20/alpha crystallin family protein [Anaerolineales bacterium]|nr:Hsp20/alpha crystallin family protein [Anaerolineales bacterium]
MTDAKKPKSKPAVDKETADKAAKDLAGASVHVDLGLGGLFKGIGNLLDLVSNLSEAGENISRTGEMKFGDDEKMKGVYGFTIRTGLGGMPKVESFGNIRESDEGPIVADTREPLVDVFEEEKNYLLVAELPGAAADEVQVEVDGDVVALSTTGNRKYAKEVLLPGPAVREGMALNYNNGVLEVRLPKAS